MARRHVNDVHINGGCEMENPPRYPIEPADVQAAYDEFMREGYLNDENSGFGTPFLKGRLDELEQGFRSLGYDGEAFERGGKYFDGNGNVLWVYDPDRLSADQAYAKTEAWIASATQRALRNPLADDAVAAPVAAVIRSANDRL